jgi:hypothetical protein
MRDMHGRHILGAAPGSAYRASAVCSAGSTDIPIRARRLRGIWATGSISIAIFPQDQERVLRNDPSFRRLPAGEQDRLVQQLHHVNQLPEEQRAATLARNEILEHMSPQEQMRVYNSMNRLNALPPIARR